MREYNYQKFEEIWERDSVVKEYISSGNLFKAEKAIYDRYLCASEFDAILDIGIGRGRTVEPLAKIANWYVGIDYSKKMVRDAQIYHPGYDIRVGDATNLRDFEDGQFDIVVFSFNGLDYIGPNDRILAIREIYRVLQFGGLFVFSSHNIEAPRRAPYSLRNIKWNKGVIKFGRSILSYFIKNLNAIRLKKYEKHGYGYSMLVDQAHHYSLVTYFTNLMKQNKQLRELGFEVHECLGIDGEPVNDRGSPHDPWITYVARKAIVDSDS